ncbi:tRNA pseudouridine(55) synthase TruB [Williamsia sp. 1135]|uniref:tRNA pseudouridine(55) synthase TruB n=1 Tax=Williamsia sp. 1135 TaxID=1889262 RepID=UPI000A111DA7|nr:tRNA pseudouridine(55) synthase TruB [Williamsia sp. 1135]ORM23919.1 tRNA pseudouridine(55) synthase TruB [Williamsia sp. 1135]
MTAPRSGLDGAGLLIIDKEQGVTSHDVVASCRKLLKTRKVGHAGTLDPMATGVLVLGVERATKMLGLLSLTTKAYVATIRLGADTDTDDAEGAILTRTDTATLDPARIAAEVQALTGNISQVPARVSAIKVDGKRAHALARDGADFELKARPVTVSRFEVGATTVTPWEAGTEGVFTDIPGAGGVFTDVEVEVDCSAGTYIRSLARDLGAALGVGGHLIALRRTRVGPFTLAEARTLTELADDPAVSLGIDDAAQFAFSHRNISADEAESISQGRWLEPIGMAGTYAAIDPDGHTIALLQEKGRRASSVMVVRPATLRQ